MSVQGFWADYPWTAFRDVPDDLIAILPLGAIEQHGPHLPLSVDRDLAEAALERGMAALDEAQNVLVLPTLSITKSNEHDLYPGTLSLSADTLLASLRDIGASVARAGVRRLVLFNGHGGNTPVLDIAARDLRIAHNLIVVTCSWFGFADYGEMFDAQELEVDIHAGDVETSAMLAQRPDRVDMVHAENFVPKQAQWRRSNRFVGLTGQAARPAWRAGDLHPAGACGDAANASAEKGAALLASAGRNIALFLAEFAAFDPGTDA